MFASRSAPCAAVSNAGRLAVRLAPRTTSSRCPLTMCSLLFMSNSQPSRSASSLATPPVAPRSARIKLRRVRKWSEFAPYISELTVTCDPAVGDAIGCVELWRQARGLAIRNKFPKYTATLDEKDDGKPAAVVVKYVDGRIQRINAAHLILLDVFDQMAEFTEALLVAEELAELDKS